MKLKKSVKIVFILAIAFVGLCLWGFAYLSSSNKTEKVNLTDDIIINNLHSEDVSNLLGNESAEKEKEETNISAAEQKDTLSTEQYSDKENNIVELDISE